MDARKTFINNFLRGYRQASIAHKGQIQADSIGLTGAPHTMFARYWAKAHEYQYGTDDFRFYMRRCNSIHRKWGEVPF
jgi:hypothetical protein